ncbi:hypothetical protein FE394_05820 [Xenorhabdus sp. Reich]|uniref:Type IV pilus biogenesis protein PilN n=1 Tax=Xenorhabdus littoralis TaxID=2582835 RepID=A0ABU4SJA2_9GAMM|nr:PilN domain-containing protein [Xenorhabdus sp. Reich]MDX7998721.1 hypothetical protein [Xenorhabdus sp. Reich]
MYQVNFLPWRQKALKRQCRKWGYLFCLQMTLWAVALVFIYTQQTNQIEQNHGQLTKFEHQLDQFQQSIRETDQVMLHHQQLTLHVRKKRAFMEQNQRYLQLFRQLPQLLPEKIWLTAFSDDSGQLVFSARSQNSQSSQNYMDISDMLDSLTGDTSLINVQLKKMTTTEDQLKVFTIDADWLMGESGGK